MRIKIISILIMFILIIFYIGCARNQKDDLCYVKGGNIELSINGIDTMINDFYIGKNEVSCKQYIEFLNDIDCNKKFIYRNNVLIMDTVFCPVTLKSSIGFIDSSFYFIGNKIVKNINCPITNITLFGTLEFCNWKSREFNLEECYTIKNDSIYYNDKANGYRLPTEVEWEYAAKAGNNYIWSGTSDTNKVTDYAWFYKNSGDKYLSENLTYVCSGLEFVDTLLKNNCSTHEIGTKKPNSYGIYNMNGNVSEMCWGEHKRNNNSILYSDKYPKQFFTIFRGGNYRYHELLCKISYRSGFYSIFSNPDVGFRVCRNI